MTIKKKIALLNFPLDGNYGGNLQRFALIKVLTDMGYDVTHLSTRFKFWETNSRYKRFKCLLRYKLGLFQKEKRKTLVMQFKYQEEMKAIMPFYEKYVPHTEPIFSYDDIRTYQNFAAYMVGSDQVWRRSMNGYFPYSTMFFDFIKNPNAKKIAYGISLGTGENELSESDLEEVSPLYKDFHAVSVREQSALTLFEQYGWTKPVAQVVLDPTLLLKKEDYDSIIENARTKRTKEKVFCYVLDLDEEKKSKIRFKIQELGKTAHYCVFGKDRISIEQWLRNIRDAKYVITDSYHGVLFSIIFNRPFLFLENKRRGNERVDYVMKFLGITNDTFDWEQINTKIDAERIKSCAFLKNALS